jgi:Alcohol dehydrogenase GroES-like domain
MMMFRAAQVTSPRGPLALVDRTLTDPAPGTVRVAVEACGICHSDAIFVDGQWPGLQFPLTPGHEIAGRIDALGEGVQGWREGERVAIGASGGYCEHCRSCRRGELVHCEAGMVTGATFPGGYAEYVVAPATALARIPDEPHKCIVLTCGNRHDYGAKTREMTHSDLREQRRLLTPSTGPGGRVLNPRYVLMRRARAWVQPNELGQTSGRNRLPYRRSDAGLAIPRAQREAVRGRRLRRGRRGRLPSDRHSAARTYTTPYRPDRSSPCTRRSSRRHWS